MKKHWWILMSFISVFAIVGCTNEKDLDITNEPRIEFKSITPTQAKQYKDAVRITLEYTDGDGDLGENVSGVSNAFVTDSRNNLSYAFRIRQLAPDNSPIALKGTLVIEVPAISLINSSSAEETAYFTVFIKDRAGHASNSIQTSAIQVLP